MLDAWSDFSGVQSGTIEIFPLQFNALDDHAQHSLSQILEQNGLSHILEQNLAQFDEPSHAPSTSTQHDFSWAQFLFAKEDEFDLQLIVAASTSEYDLNRPRPGGEPGDGMFSRDLYDWYRMWGSTLDDISDVTELTALVAGAGAFLTVEFPPVAAMLAVSGLASGALTLLLEQIQGYFDDQSEAELADYLPGSGGPPSDTGSIQ